MLIQPDRTCSILALYFLAMNQCSSRYLFSFSWVSQALCEECECCNRALAELGASVQEFWEQNPLLCKQLGDAVTKLTELQVHTFQQVQDRANRLKKVGCPQMCGLI